MKKILTILTIMILMSGIVLAGQIPEPMNVKLNAQNNAGQRVDITNMDESITKTFYTNAFGEIAEDAGVQFGSGNEGDAIKVVIFNCLNRPECTQTKVFNEGILFIITTDHIFPEVILPTPVEPEIIEVEVPIEVPVEVIVEKECESEGIFENPFVAGSVGALLVALLVGLLLGDFGVLVDREKWQLFKYFKTWLELEDEESINVILKRTKDGELQVDGRSHGHLGHKRLHSIHIEHRTYKHPKGILNPNYDEDGNYIGGDE